MKQWMRVSVILAACAVALTFAADDSKPAGDAGDVAWAEVLKTFRPPPPPAEWREKEPTQEQIAAWEKGNGLLAGKAADKAREFYTKFPSHASATEAKRMELKLLEVAVQLGDTNRQARFETLQEKRLSDPAVSPDEKFALRAQRIANLIMNDESTNRRPGLAKAEKAARDLQQEFPKKDEAHQLLLMIAQGYLDADDLAGARAIAEDVAKKAGDEPKTEAQTLLRKLDRVGKPFELKFTDLQGRERDVKNLAGKVVLVDFWATWCGPCRAALPEVKEVYAKYRARGFEILAISFDQEKDALTEFIANEKLEWPQYFDGTGWENKIGKACEITSLPTVWLLDKKGNLRELNGLRSLTEKVEKLLAEK